MAKAVALRSVFIPHSRVQVDTGDVSMTRQEFKKECDINEIMSRYNKTGVIQHMNKASPRYLDLSNVPDLQSSLNFMKEAEAAFSALPATVRKEFGNDASEFVKFAENSDNLPQMRKWGLAAPEKTLPEAASPIAGGGNAPVGERDTPASGTEGVKK